MAYLKQAGHCTRCEAPFAADATIFMVRESVIWEMRDDGTGFYQTETVAVCERCLTVKEQGQNHLDITVRRLRASADTGGQEVAQKPVACHCMF